MLFDIMNLKTENIRERSKGGKTKTAEPPKPFPCNTDATFIDPCRITLLESRDKNVNLSTPTHRTNEVQWGRRQAKRKTK